MSAKIRSDLLQRAGEFHITLEDVSITHLTFGKVCFDVNKFGALPTDRLLYRNSPRFVTYIIIDGVHDTRFRPLKRNK